MNKKFKIVIVGGGSAGWMTALFIKKYINCDITLVESEEIGILGAGEGTTPNFVSFIQELGIDINKLIKETGGTLKNGISFERWNQDKDDDFYFHPFEVNTNELIAFGSNSNLKEYCVSKEIDFVKTEYVSKISYMNRVPFIYENGKVFGPFSSFGVHFNARKLAEYLKKIGTERGIKRIEGKVKKIVNDENQYIDKIILENEQELELDFVFDCSGFKRLIIGNHYKEKWISATNSLPIKKAIPFFLPQENEKIISYTKAIAMKYGWLWMIPLQERFGCGYLYDSDYVSDDEAKKEIDILLEQEVEVRGQFVFSAGYYHQAWVKNCIAIGLSSGFFEPLEATSIFSFIFNLKNILNSIEGFLKDDKHMYIRNNYNEIFRKTNEDILNFIYLHYLTERNDSIFWQEFEKKNEMPEGIQEIMEIIKTRKIHKFDVNKQSLNSFSIYSYLLILDGIKKIKKEHYAKHIDYLAMNNYNNHMVNLNHYVMNSMSHKQFLNIQKNMS